MLHNVDTGEAQSRSSTIEPTGQVAFQLLFGLFVGLKGLDPLLDARLQSVLDNTVMLVEATCSLNDENPSDLAVLTLVQSFRESYLDADSLPR